MGRSASRGAVRAGSAARTPRRRLRRPSPGETGLLELARALDVVAAAPSPGDTVGEVLTCLAQAFDPGAPLPRQLAQAWLRTRGDKTGALALGWAREQVRRALAEALLRAWGPASATADMAAWVLLAAAEAEAREPGGSVGDRLRTVCDAIRRSARS